MFSIWEKRCNFNTGAREGKEGKRRRPQEAAGGDWPRRRPLPGAARPLLPTMRVKRGRRAPSRPRRFRARPFDTPPPPTPRERPRPSLGGPPPPLHPRPWGRVARGSPRRGPDGRRGPARVKGASSYSPRPAWPPLLPPPPSPPPERAAAILSAPPARRSRPAPSASLTARAAILSPLPRRPAPVHRRPPLLGPARRPQPRPRLAPCPTRPSLFVSRRHPAHHRSARPARPA